MIGPLSALLLVSTVFAAPILRPRVVQELDQAAFEEAQQRDDTATRAFSSTEIKVYSSYFVLKWYSKFDPPQGLEWAVSVHRHPFWRLPRELDTNPSYALQRKRQPEVGCDYEWKACQCRWCGCHCQLANSSMHELRSSSCRR